MFTRIRTTQRVTQCDYCFWCRVLFHAKLLVTNGFNFEFDHNGTHGSITSQSSYLRTVLENTFSLSGFSDDWGLFSVNVAVSVSTHCTIRRLCEKFHLTAYKLARSSMHDILNICFIGILHWNHVLILRVSKVETMENLKMPS